MSCSENKQTRYLESHKLREFSVFLHVPSLQKKQRNQMIEFPWELYYLVELFLLWYVICASVPKERTRILRWLVLTFSRGESIACAYPNQLCTHETWQKTIWQHAAIFMQFFYTFLYGYFWPVLNTIHVHLTLCTLQNPFLTIYFKNTIISMLNWSLSLMWRIPQIILHLWGFSCIRDAGRRGNRTTVSAAS